MPAPRSLTFPLARFDPLACMLALCPDGPGFLDSPGSGSPDTARHAIVPLRRRETYRLDGAGLAWGLGKDVTRLTGDPLENLQRILDARRISSDLLFPGGFFGFFGYDLAGWVETLTERARRDLPVPQLHLDWVDLTAVYDRQEGNLTLASLTPEDDLERLAEQIVRSQAVEVPDAPWTAPRPLAADLDPEAFIAMVRRAQEYIAAGDIYQANLSCRFSGSYPGSIVPLYQRLRRLNPSPFACLLRAPGVEIASSSPERLVSLRGRLAETRPIAGTRRRGASPAEDEGLLRELLAHPKERAEHIMLLDLERNDLGKVCVTGSVEVDELMVLESYSHVSHIVSNVRGKLKADATPCDLLRAVFPGGTITGVPKKRCMEIIDELEPTGRGVYTGSAGYLSASGNLDLNILIRSFQKCGEHLSFQVGAGIVADSVPEQEWQECLVKGEALQRALQP